MRHLKSGKKLSRNTKQRKALFKSLILALVRSRKIITTLAKARAIKSIAEKLIKKAQEGGIANTRKLISFLGDRKLAFDLIKDAKSFPRQSGFLRIIKIGMRCGDAAPMAMAVFVDKKTEESKNVKKEGKKEKESVSVPTPVKTSVSKGGK